MLPFPIEPRAARTAVKDLPGTPERRKSSFAASPMRSTSDDLPRRPRRVRPCSRRRDGITDEIQVSRAHPFSASLKQTNSPEGNRRVAASYHPAEEDGESALLVVMRKVKSDPMGPRLE